MRHAATQYTHDEGHLAQPEGWLFEPLIEIIEEHLKTFKDHPPVQGGSSPDLSTMVPD